METKVLLTEREVKMFTMMKALDALGVFDITYGSASINFDGQGKISNVKIERNYRLIPK